MSAAKSYVGFKKNLRSSFKETVEVEDGQGDKFAIVAEFKQLTQSGLESVVEKKQDLSDFLNDTVINLYDIDAPEQPISNEDKQILMDDPGMAAALQEKFFEKFRPVKLCVAKKPR
jgi:hypothetical protein